MGTEWRRLNKIQLRQGDLLSIRRVPLALLVNTEAPCQLDVFWTGRPFRQNTMAYIRCRPHIAATPTCSLLLDVDQSATFAKLCRCNWWVDDSCESIVAIRARASHLARYPVPMRTAVIDCRPAYPRKLEAEAEAESRKPCCAYAYWDMKS
jgi:hypothetical protein